LGYVILSEAKNLSSAQPRFFTPLRSVQNDGIEFNIVEVCMVGLHLPGRNILHRNASRPHYTMKLYCESDGIGTALFCVC
jgi:hypothetical protein